jgi:hypothetical protein
VLCRESEGPCAGVGDSGPGYHQGVENSPRSEKQKRMPITTFSWPVEHFRMFEADGDHSYLKDSAGPLSTAQKASRSNTPIADIKPASNAKSRITSIKRVSVFFGRFTVIYGFPPGVRTKVSLFVNGPSLRLSSTYKGFAGRQFQQGPF